MDIGDTITPKTDQQNFDMYLSGPRTFTIQSVKVVGGEQPVHIELVEDPGKPYKPNLSMRRVLTKFWGKDSSAYAGRRITLFGNPDVKYGGKSVGGIEIGAMSDLEKPMTMLLTSTRGRKSPFTVQPIIEQAPIVPDDIVQAASKAHSEGNLEAYRDWLQEKGAPAHIMKFIEELESK